MTDEQDIDPCGLIDFADPTYLTDDGEQQIAVCLFGDLDWTDSEQVEARRAAWTELFQ